jgi:hypothetical protein
VPLLKAGAFALYVALAAPLVAAEPAPAAAGPTEYEVKAAFLFNFAKFIEWPPSKARAENFTIAILGQDPFGDVLDRMLRGKTLGERKLVIKRIASTADVGDASILFIGDSEKARLPQILKDVQGTGVLTVGDMADFAARGGVIGFRTEDNVVRFDINLAQAQKAGLKLSSQLIRVARHVLSADQGS